jgi:hypothetical protein
MKFFHAQKNDMESLKIFVEEKIFIQSPYYEKKKKKHTHPFSPTTHITKEIIP